MTEEAGPRTADVYEVVRQRGVHEISRPSTSLWWSGAAGGLSMSFSLLMQAVLERALPDTEWRSLISSAGYSVGFLMAVLSGQQLFTEATITVVLPVMVQRDRASLVGLARVWAIVLAANIAGTLFAALFCTFTSAVSPEQLATMLDVSERAMRHGWIEMFFKAISAGFLMAAMVWLLPGAEHARFWVIAFMTYVIGVCGFVHIVAGGMEAFLLVANGRLDVAAMIGQFMIPALAGNVVGGTALFALLAYAQVMKEV